jgi:hypothetical protein
MNLTLVGLFFAKFHFRFFIHLEGRVFSRIFEKGLIVHRLNERSGISMVGMWVVVILGEIVLRGTVVVKLRVFTLSHVEMAFVGLVLTEREEVSQSNAHKRYGRAPDCEVEILIFPI